jgi:hypothetical protein
MKKKVTIIFSFTILLLLIIISCEKNFSEMASHNDEIIAAQNWYETICSSSGDLKHANFTKNKMQVKPCWENAFYKKHAGFITVEVPLSTRGRFGYATQESELAYKETGDDRFIQSLTRMVVLTKEKGNTTIGFLMTIIPDKDYQVATDFHMFSSSYKKWGKGFSGLVLYHNLEGGFLNGWKLSEGKVVKTVKQKTYADSDIQLKSENKSYELRCYDTFLLVWYQDCTEWYTNGVYTNTTCGPGHLEMEPWYTICDYFEVNGGNSGGGGGGGVTDSESEPYSPKPGDKFSKPNINSQMPTQIPNGCVPSIMEYINHELCGGNVNQGVYVMDYLDTFGSFILTDGVALSDIEPFVNMNFNTTAFSGFANAIDQGNIVMADIVSSIANSGHNIAVVGYHPDGTLIYMDPEYGTFREAPASEVGQNYGISITSCK